MTRSQVAVSLLAWAVVGAGWFVLTRSFHPTASLAVIVTGALVTAYAAAVYVNHLVLVPAFWRAGRRWVYGLLLLLVMATFTGIALAIIRVSYFSQLGPDPDPNGAAIHFAIDFFGMAVHVAAAAIVVGATRRFFRTR